mgnify:CR=1 FL=1
MSVVNRVFISPEMSGPSWEWVENNSLTGETFPSYSPCLLYVFIHPGWDPVVYHSVKLRIIQTCNTIKYNSDKIMVLSVGQIALWTIDCWYIKLMRSTHQRSEMLMQLKRKLMEINLCMNRSVENKITLPIKNAEKKNIYIYYISLFEW